MAEFTSHEPGSFCFIEAGSTDVGASRDFYTAIFGWEAEEHPTADGDLYTRFLKRGKPVAGMYALGDEQQPIGISSHWVSYVSVEDASATLKKAVEALATPLGGLIEVPGIVTVAEFADPDGAICGVWQPGAHIGAVYANEPGTLIWNELLTHDPAAAALFYCGVFDWTHEVQETPAGSRHLFMSGDALRGGMMTISPEMGEVAPSWGAYIAVGDLDASMAKVTDLGGSIEGGAIDLAGGGRKAAVRDPTGVGFMFMEPAQGDSSL
jgi:hypothetical protein